MTSILESGATAPEFTVNHLVAVKGQVGTHTVRAVPDGVRQTYSVDVFGRLLELEAAQLSPAPAVVRDRQHRVLVGPEQSIATAAVLNANRDRVRQEKLGADRSAHPQISGLTATRDDAFTKLARIEVTGVDNGTGAGGKPKLLGDAGLTFSVVVRGNTGFTADPYDLVPVILERPVATPVDTVVVLTPGADATTPNVYSFTVNYSLVALAKLLGLAATGTPAELAARIEAGVPELGVRAEWRASNGQNNATNHYSGGLGLKDNTGKLRLAPVTTKALKATENTRNTDWNCSEDLHPTRPVVTRFPALLQLGPGKQLATTLEAEAEFRLPTEQAQQKVIARLKALCDDPGPCAPVVVSCTEGETKTYTDTYYDVVKDGKSRWSLLSKRVVLRRRSVASDPAGTFLFAVKGRTTQRTVVSRTGTSGSIPTTRKFDEFIRLAAQVQLADNHRPEDLRAFLTENNEANVDNPLARILQDALIPQTYAPGPSLPWSDLGGAWSFAPVLEVVSVRSKFTITLANSVTVDVTVDRATGTALLPGRGKPSEPVFSFELGVGHPGLVTTNLTAAPPPPVESAQPQVVRPYHVPKDLTQDLFNKADYGQFRGLCDVLLPEIRAVLGLAPADKLALGGNKAADLAVKLGLISGK